MRFSFLYKFHFERFSPSDKYSEICKQLLARDTNDKQMCIITNLTFIGPCIVIFPYSKTKQMHQFLKLFIFP
jgi:hypothetical protein